MKTLAACTLAGLASVVLLSATAPAQDPSALVARVTALEEEVVALKKQLNAEPADEQAELDAARLRDGLNATLTYLHARAKSDKALLAELDRVEALGFTAGINAASRETLLAGMRAHLTASATGLPAPAPAKDGTGEPDASRR